MGPEMELHTITKSTLIYIPANFLHCPMHYRNVEKVTHPIIFIQAQYSPKLNEKSFKKLVKESERDKMIFFDLEGNETDEEWDKQRAELKTRVTRRNYPPAHPQKRLSSLPTRYLSPLSRARMVVSLAMAITRSRSGNGR